MFKFIVGLICVVTMFSVQAEQKTIHLDGTTILYGETLAMITVDETEELAAMCHGGLQLTGKDQMGVEHITYNYRCDINGGVDFIVRERTTGDIQVMLYATDHPMNEGTWLVTHMERDEDGFHYEEFGVEGFDLSEVLDSWRDEYLVLHSI